MQRRELIIALCLAGAATMAPTAGALAQDYPSKPITLIVPFAAGGTTDVIGRLVAERLGAHLNQTIVVENRSGAGGSIGSAAVANAAPDGYTLGLATVSTHGINPAVYPNLPFDAKKTSPPSPPWPLYLT